MEVMKPELQFVSMEGVPIVKQLEVEEALLRVGKGNWCLVNHGSPPAIILGLSSKLEECVCERRVKENPIPLLRRFSGGGTVVVDENTLFFTLILEKAECSFDLTVEGFMRWTEGIFSPVFAPHVFSVRENDYVVGKRKIGGNAQSFTRDKVLQHTSFLWSWDPQMMQYLQHPRISPKYRDNRPHEDFCGKICDYFPSKNNFLERIEESLDLFFLLKKSSLENARKSMTFPHAKRLNQIFF